MKEIDRTIPSNFSELERRSKVYFDRIRSIFKDKDFKVKILKIREKFDIPADGIKQFRGVVEPRDESLTPEAIRIADKLNRDKFINYLSLIHGDRDLKGLNYSIKSKKLLFQKDISRLLKTYKLPERFRGAFIQYVIFDSLPVISGYSFPCSVSVHKDRKIKRLFIELYGDTKREHIREAWKIVRRAREKHLAEMKSSPSHKKYSLRVNKRKKMIMIEIFWNTKKDHIDSAWSKIKGLIEKNKIPGRQLFRYHNFYLMELFGSGEYVLDKKDSPMDDERIANLKDYDRKNLYVWRHKRYIKKYT